MDPNTSPESDKRATPVDSDNASDYDMEPQDSSTSQIDQKAFPQPSLAGLATELIEEICQYLGPADIASFGEGSNSRLSVIARPFLAPRTCQLNFSNHSIGRLRGFLKENEWKRRIETIQYNISHRADPNFPVMSWDDYIRLEFGYFTDLPNKVAQFQAYQNWHTTQLGEEIAALRTCKADEKSIREAMEQLPNLRSVDIVLLPCTARRSFTQRLQGPTVSPHGFFELRRIYEQLMDPELKTTCTALRIVGVDQISFDGQWWNNYSPANTITKLELLLKDKYCRTMRFRWSLRALTSFLQLFPNLEDLTLGLNVCQEPDCLGELFLLPDVDHRQERFLPLSSANLSSATFRIPKLRRLTLKNVRLDGGTIVKFVDNHLGNQNHPGDSGAGEQEQQPASLFELNLINCQLDESASQDFDTLTHDTLTTELVSQRGIILNVLAVDHLTGQEERGEMDFYASYDDPRQQTNFILRRKNGKDYIATPHGLSIREQRSGIIGEDVVLFNY